MMTASEPGVTAAVCVLTLTPTSPLNRRMNVTFNLAPSPRVMLRWCIFDDEGKPWHRSMPTTIVLRRPAFVTLDRRYQCVAKILAWLDHAQTFFSHAQFIGWMDSDTWVLPKRLETYLDGVAEKLPPATHASWIGLAMHWSRFDEQILDGIGFMHTPHPSQERHARKLTWDRRENLKHMKRHLAALGNDPRHYRTLSFTMTQGCFTLFSAAALRTLLDFVRSPTGPHRAFLGLDQTANVPTMPAHSNKCVLPTDVALGWLMTRAYAGRRGLHVVNLYGLFELFVWESGRVNANHTLITHLAQARARLITHLASSPTSPHLPPRLISHLATSLVSPRICRIFSPLLFSRSSRSLVQLPSRSPRMVTSQRRLISLRAQSAAVPRHSCARG